MNRTQFNKVVVPGLFSFMKEGYKPRSGEGEEWRQLVEAAGSVKSSKRAYEEAAYYAGFGNVPTKAEGGAIAYAIKGERLDVGSKLEYAKAFVKLGLRNKEIGVEFKRYIQSFNKH